MGDAAAFTAALDRAGHFVTGPRRAVAELLVERDEYFSALELVREAKRRRLGVGRATVFRALELFEELGLVERLDLPNGRHAYVVCQPHRHHHHVVCTHCGRSAEVRDLGVEALAAEVRARNGFVLDSHRIELYGVCPACQRDRAVHNATEPADHRPTP
jgi:Fe2+ or Zn2+ uptake regulation protein